MLRGALYKKGLKRHGEVLILHFLMFNIVMIKKKFVELLLYFYKGCDEYVVSELFLNFIIFDRFLAGKLFDSCL